MNEKAKSVVNELPTRDTAAPIPEAVMRKAGIVPPAVISATSFFPSWFFMWPSHRVGLYSCGMSTLDTRRYG